MHGVYLPHCPKEPRVRGRLFNWRRVLGATLELLDVIDPSLLMDK